MREEHQKLKILETNALDSIMITNSSSERKERRGKRKRRQQKRNRKIKRRSIMKHLNPKTLYFEASPEFKKGLSRKKTQEKK